MAYRRYRGRISNPATLNSMITVTLTEAEIRVCTQPAVERWLLKRKATDKPGYAAGKASGKLQHELLANITANIAEYAVAKQFKQPWNFPWYMEDEHRHRKDHPDVGTNIEVRTVRTQNAIPIWQKDITKQAIIAAAKVTDTDYFSTIDIYGFYKATEARRDDWRDDFINGWRIPLTEFTHG